MTFGVPAGTTQAAYPWRVFVALAALCEVAVVLAVPRPLSVAVLVGVSVIMTGAVALGLFLGRRAHLGAPLLEAWLYGATRPPRWSPRLAAGLITGVALGVAVAAVLGLLLIPAVPDLRSRFVTELAMPAWKRWIIVFDAAVLEETLFRLLILSSVAWVIRRLARSPQGPPGGTTAWAANVVAALTFALAHVPQWLAISPGNRAVLAAVMATNTIAGLVFGRLFLRRGIETAMAAHLGADIVVHVAAPGFLAV